MDTKIYECLECHEGLGLKDRPVMTIRRGKPMYFCQKCWAVHNKPKSGGPSMAPKVQSAPATKPVTTAPPPPTAPRPPTAPAPPPAASQPKKDDVPKPRHTDAAPKPKSADAQIAGMASRNLYIDENEGSAKAGMKCTSCMKPTSASELNDESNKPKGVCGDCQKQFAKDMQKELEQKQKEKTGTCFICEKGLVGTYYTCGELNYHEKCITCHSCGKKDRDGWDECVIYPSDDGKGVKFYCGKCNLESAPKCYSCSKPITDGVLSVGSGDNVKQYHANCLNCGQCGANMSRGEELIYLNGILTCSKCRNDRALMCKRCKESISGAYNSVKGDGDIEKYHYHSKCFMCRYCDNDLNERELGGKTPDDDHEIICKECYLDKHCEKCARCPKPLIGAFFRLGGEKICKDCCRCGSCGGEITSQFKMKPDGAFQCVSDSCPGNRDSN